MQFPVDITKILPTDEKGICLLNGKSIRSSTLQKINSRYNSTPLKSIINTMGALSAKAQKLKTVITTFAKFSGTNQRLYIKISDGKVVGILKTGEKDLFYRDVIGDIKELSCTCVLDFYVHESCQRRGFGKVIFEKMLEYEGLKPFEFAYDRPSGKLLKFLKKHYGLWEFVPQNNNYVIYHQFFSKGRFGGGKRRGRNTTKHKAEMNYGITSQLKGRYASREPTGRSKMNRQASYKNLVKEKDSMRKNGYRRNAANIIGGGFNLKASKHENYLSALEKKIKKTENEINLVQDRLKRDPGTLPSLAKRNIRSLYGAIGSKRGTSEVQRSYLTGGMPWATHHDLGNATRNRNDTSSMNYGSHYFFGR